MPASVSFSAPSSRLTTDLVARLASSDREVQLKALRELKNQIIGNRTKKLTYIKLGAVPAVASVLSDAIEGCYGSNLLVQSAAALGSFACGFDAGVRAVLDAGALPNLVRLLSSPEEKVMDAGARSLKMIYQSNLAPKYDFLDTSNMDFLLLLLNSKSENVTGLGASIITHSCKTSTEQKALYDAQVMIKLVDFLGGSLSMKDASLESLASLIKNNSEVACKFAEFEAGKGLNLIIKATLDRSPRTRLLACACLVSLRNVSPSYLKSKGMESKLIFYLLELMEDPGHVGDEASFILSSLVEDNEDLQKITFEANAIEILCNHLQKELLRPRRIEGIILALANVCANLEICRSKLLPLEAFNLVNDALSHDCGDVRVAACLCLRSVSRSVQNLSAGFFKKEKIVTPLLQLLHDPESTVQLAALRAISNIVIDFRTRESMFVRCGGLEQLLQLSMSMNSTMRSNSLWALRNFTFHTDNKFKEEVFSGLTASSLASLICDTESTVQEQALALVRNLSDGSLESVEYVFAEDCRILDATTRQLQSSSKDEIGIQGMHVLNNVASGTEVHKDAVMDQLLQHRGGNDTQLFIIRFLQSNDKKLRTVSVWLIVNLTNSSCPGAPSRVAKLRNAGVVTQLKSMVNDPCLDVKLRVRTILCQYMTFGDS